MLNCLICSQTCLSVSLHTLLVFDLFYIICPFIDCSVTRDEDRRVAPGTMSDGEDCRDVKSPHENINDDEQCGTDDGRQEIPSKHSADDEVSSTSNELPNHSFRNYFCIFCDSKFDALQSAFDHFKQHMSFSFYCKICDYKLSNAPSSDEPELDTVKKSVCNIDHSQQETDISKESTTIEMWIERFLSYQDEIQNKTDSSVITSTKFFLGCPACDILIKECNVPVPKDVLEYREATCQSSSQCGPNAETGHHHPGTSSSSPTVPLFGGGKESVKCHTVRHACAHLRYYPYECFACEEVGKYQKKPDISEMMRHIKDTHVKNNFHLLMNQPLEQLVKFVRITKLERFIEYYLKAHPMVRFDPVPSTGKRSKPIYTISSTSPGKMSHAKFSAAPPQQQRVPSILIKKTTSGSGSVYQTALSHRPLPSAKVSDSQPSTSVGHSPSRTTHVKHNQPNEQLSLTAETDRSNFHRQFGNIFDEEMMSMAMNNEQDLNVEYFCIFCRDLKTKDKEEARRHYQRHVDYYPLVCSLCGEGTCDLPEFLKHHTTKHPDSEKGRYKRRQQTQIEKWINGFLYAQSTIIRAFPPREQCLVCEQVFDPELIASVRPRRCTINRKIDHFHRHLCYLPYECMKCKEEGKEFLVAYFESKAHSHIKLKHPDVDDQESRWFVFQKTTSIPKLDEFISSYLKTFGISMEFERRPVKKAHQRDAGDNLIHDGNNNLSLLARSPSAAVGQSVESGSSSDGEMAEGSEMVVPVSPNMVDIDSLENQDPTLKSNLFCLFCPTIFRSKFEAFEHYSSHLSYEPVVCLLCSSRFFDIDSFSIHHQNKHPSAPDLMYEVREDFVLEKWLDNFLLTQKRNQCKSSSLNCSCSSSCPVCEKIFDLADRTPVTGPCTIHSESDFSNHVHQHLAYFEYECSLCQQNPGCLASFKVTNLDLSALDHVKRVHRKCFESAGNVTVYELANIFEKVKPVPKIEEFISESIGIRNFNEKRFRENDREKRAESTKSQNPTLNHLLGLSTVIPNHQVRSSAPNQNFLQNRTASINNRSQMWVADVNRSPSKGFTSLFGERKNQKMRVVEQGNRMVLRLAVPKKHQNASPYSRVIPQPKKVSV